MPTYVTATVKVKDPEKLQIYLSQLPSTMAPFGGKPVCRGKAVKALHGSADFHIMATFVFADQDKAEAWYNSDAYQALIPNRDEAIDGQIVIVQG